MNRPGSYISGPGSASGRLGYVFANLLNGLSHGSWVDKHNAHHAHPNVVDTHPDVHPGFLVFDAEHARNGTEWAPG